MGLYLYIYIYLQIYIPTPWQQVTLPSISSLAEELASFSPYSTQISRPNTPVPRTVTLITTIAYTTRSRTSNKATKASKKKGFRPTPCCGCCPPGCHQSQPAPPPPPGRTLCGRALRSQRRPLPKSFPKHNYYSHHVVSESSMAFRNDRIWWNPASRRSSTFWECLGRVNLALRAVIPTVTLRRQNLLTAPPALVISFSSTSLGSLEFFYPWDRGVGLLRPAAVRDLFRPQSHGDGSARINDFLTQPLTSV